MRPSTDLHGTNLRGTNFPSSRAASVHDPDDLNKVKRVIQQAQEDTEIFPASHNFNAHTQNWDSGDGRRAQGPGQANAVLRQELLRLLTAFPAYHGLSFDFETSERMTLNPAYVSFIQELYSDLHPRNLHLYVNVPASMLCATICKTISANSDGVMLMNYDEHETESQPGPIASQDWFVANLNRVLKSIRAASRSSSAQSATTDTTGRCPSPTPRLATQS